MNVKYFSTLVSKIKFNIKWQTLNNLIKYEEKAFDKTKFVINRYLENNLLVKDIIIESNNKIYKFQEKVKAYRIEDFLTMFKECDLKFKEKFGDYNLNSFNKNSSPRLIMVFEWFIFPIFYLIQIDHNSYLVLGILIFYPLKPFELYLQ